MAGLIQLSEAASLALHGMGLLATSRRRMSVKELASATGASEAHLAKVFQRLGKEGYVFSTRGPHGGFVLAKPPEEISLLDIYRAIEGEPSREYCLLRRESCPFGRCIFGCILKRLSEEFLTYLSSKTLADLSGPRSNEGREAGFEVVSMSSNLVNQFKGQEG